LIIHLTWNKLGHTFRWLAASPQTFHVANRSVLGVRGGNAMVTGRTLFVGCELRSVGVEDSFVFLGDFGSSEDVDFRFPDEDMATNSNDAGMVTSVDLTVTYANFEPTWHDGQS
jgi:hypothetical protein